MNEVVLVLPSGPAGGVQNTGLQIEDVGVDVGEGGALEALSETHDLPRSPEDAERPGEKAGKQALRSCDDFLVGDPW